MAEYLIADGAIDTGTLRRISSATNLKVTQRLERIDALGNVLDNLTPWLVSAENGRSVGNTVKHDNDATAPGTYNFTISKPLRWGRDIVRPVMAIEVTQTPAGPYSVGDILLFRLGAYIPAAPELPLFIANSSYRVQAYDKVYLLMSDVGDTFSATPNGSITYANRVGRLMQLAGITNALIGSPTTGTLNPAVVDFPSSWSSKVIPSTIETKTWPNDDSNSFTFVEIINALLKASGMRNIYTDSNGQFVISELIEAPKVPAAWTFDTSYKFCVLLREGNSLANDVWNLPNQVVYVQSGLTFDPIEGSGQYTINNVSSDPAHYYPPADQGSVGRIIRKVKRLDASGQADLKKQAEVDFTDTYAEAEVYSLSTTPWPIAGHFDAFNLRDSKLDDGGTKVMTRTWELPLDGSAMTWSARAVGAS